MKQRKRAKVEKQEKTNRKDGRPSVGVEPNIRCDTDVTCDFNFENIEILPDGNIREKPKKNVLDCQLEAVLYCLIQRRKIIFHRRFNKSKELTPFNVASAVFVIDRPRDLKRYLSYSDSK